VKGVILLCEKHNFPSVSRPPLMHYMYKRVFHYRASINHSLDRTRLIALPIRGGGDQIECIPKYQELPKLTVVFARVEPRPPVASNPLDSYTFEATIIFGMTTENNVLDFDFCGVSVKLVNVSTRQGLSCFHFFSISFFLSVFIRVHPWFRLMSNELDVTFSRHDKAGFQNRGRVLPDRPPCAADGADKLIPLDARRIKVGFMPAGSTDKAKRGRKRGHSAASKERELTGFKLDRMSRIS
jgi:hypothetical protein